MDEIDDLTQIELIPVIGLLPSRFAAQPKPWWEATADRGHENRHQYWSECLLDSGIVGLEPIERGSWNVALSELIRTDLLAKILDIHLKDQGGIGSLQTLEDVRPFEGGIALRCRSRELLIEPTCCTSLRDSQEWRAAAEYRESEWAMLWIGHPWLSMTYREPHLILSEPHESDDPVPRWRVLPEEVVREAGRLERDLEEFRGRLTSILRSQVVGGDCERVADSLMGWFVD